VLEKLGKPDEALARYREALEITARLAEAEPLNTAKMRGLALAYGKVARLLARRGEGAGAVDMLRKAVELDRRRADADPTNVQARRDYASSVYGLGAAVARTDPAAALEMFRECERVMRQIVETDPNSAAARSDLASVHDVIGAALAKLGRFDEAAVEYQRGLDEWRARHAADPANVEHLEYLAESLLTLGDLRARLGGAGAGRPLYEEAEAALAPHAARGPLPPELAQIHQRVRERLEGKKNEPQMNADERR
jgi:tetratricopeptide (TPR) repeat protein